MEVKIAIEGLPVCCSSRMPQNTTSGVDYIIDNFSKEVESRYVTMYTARTLTKAAETRNAFSS